MSEIYKDRVTITVNGKDYICQVAVSDEEREVGLMYKDFIAENEGMIFVIPEEENGEVSFWMKDTDIHLDIIFMCPKGYVISVHEGIPGDTTPITEEHVKFVLELPYGSGVREGDIIDLDNLEDYLEDRLDSIEGGLHDPHVSTDINNEVKNIENTLIILDSNGDIQAKMKGGERIFSRKNTKVLIRQAKKADRLKTDSAYKRLGKSVFRYMKIQDETDPEFVELNDVK